MKKVLIILSALVGSGCGGGGSNENSDSGNILQTDDQTTLD